MSAFVAERNGNTRSGEVDWEKLNKTKLFVVGTGLFSAVSTLLYPFSVVKTRLQVSSANQASTSPNATTWKTVQNIAKTDGLLGFYRGFGTVIAGTIPSRVVYLSILEITKASITRICYSSGFSDAFAAGVASGAGGLCGSLAVQTVLVPVDVISSRLMAQGDQNPRLQRYKGGLDALKMILRNEGIRGLYRGFGMSIITYVPSSGIWWATYGTSQRLLWKHFGDQIDYHDALPNEAGNTTDANNPNSADNFSVEDTHRDHRGGSSAGIKTVLFQALGGTCAGLTAAVVTTPLDTLKTRIQVLQRNKDRIPLLQVARELVREKGWRGFYAGLFPRCVSMSLWGTCMITTYEFLKRLAAEDSSGIDG